MKRTALPILCLFLGIILAGCFAELPAQEAEKPAGFFMGIWHGWIAPVALIVKIFKPEITVFARNNTGFWYELGFYMAIISGFGGLGFARGHKHSSRHENRRKNDYCC